MFGLWDVQHDGNPDSEYDRQSSPSRTAERVQLEQGARRKEGADHVERENWAHLKVEN